MSLPRRASSAVPIGDARGTQGAPIRGLLPDSGRGRPGRGTDRRRRRGPRRGRAPVRVRGPTRDVPFLGSEKRGGPISPLVEGSFRFGTIPIAASHDSRRVSRAETLGCSVAPTKSLPGTQLAETRLTGLGDGGPPLLVPTISPNELLKQWRASVWRRAEGGVQIAGSPTTVFPGALNTNASAFHRHIQAAHRCRRTFARNVHSGGSQHHPVWVHGNRDKQRCANGSRVQGWRHRRRVLRIR